MRFDGEGVKMTLRLLWRVCGVVWARRLGGREEGRRVGVVGRGMRVLVGTLLRVVVRPLLCGWWRDEAWWCGLYGWIVGVADRKIVDRDATDDCSKQARQDPLACERPKLLPRHSLEPINQFNP